MNWIFLKTEASLYTYDPDVLICVAQRPIRILICAACNPWVFGHKLDSVGHLKRRI